MTRAQRVNLGGKAPRDRPPGHLAPTEEAGAELGILDRAKRAVETINDQGHEEAIPGIRSLTLSLAPTTTGIATSLIQIRNPLIGELKGAEEHGHNQP